MSAVKTLLDYFVSSATPQDTGPSDYMFISPYEETAADAVVHVDVEVDIIEETMQIELPAGDIDGIHDCNFRYAVAAAASNDPGEDRSCVCITPDIQAFAVYDGHGGNLACDIAMSTLVDVICEKVRALGTQADEDSIRIALEDAYQQCDNMILKEAEHIVNCNMIAEATNGVSEFTNRRGQAKGSTPLRGAIYSTRPDGRAAGCSWNGKEYFPISGKKPERAGSCAVIALFLERKLVISHVGDCRAFQLSRKDLSTHNSNGNSSSTSLDTLGSSTAQLRKSPRKKMRSASISSLVTAMCSEEYGVTETGYIVQCLTVDHSCEQAQERDLVFGVTSDPTPFRPSRGDVAALGVGSAPLRVAGSLSVTRALGDGYLKRRDLSIFPYADYVPYITCKPTVRHCTIGASDIGLILASDGFWNNVSILETVLIVEEELLQCNNDSSSASVSASLNGFKRKRTNSCVDLHTTGSIDDLTIISISGHVADSIEQRVANALMKKCVTNAAASCHVSAKSLNRMPPSQKRRDLIDDVTIMVILYNQKSIREMSPPVLEVKRRDDEELVHRQKKVGI